MKSSDRTALVYGLSILGSAAYSYIKEGKREWLEIGTDAVLYGGMVGTGVNVVFWLSENASAPVATPTAMALPNGGQEKCKPMGKLAAEGMHLLSTINPEVLYKAAHKMGVQIGPEPKDVYKVILPES